MTLEFDKLQVEINKKQHKINEKQTKLIEDLLNRVAKLEKYRGYFK